MTTRPSFQFYPADWRKDQGLRLCSLAARGLWIDMLCLMHEAEPYGHLIVAGEPIGAEELARIIGESPREVEKWMGELKRRKVYSETTHGIIFSRRMVSDETERGQWRDRQRDKREKADGSHVDVTENVTHESRRSSSSSSSISSLRSDSVSKALNGLRSPKPKPSEPEGFADFYALFRKKDGPADAQKAYAAALKSGATPERLLAGARRYVAETAGDEKKYTKGPARWLRAGCWRDEPEENSLPLAPPAQANGMNGNPICVHLAGESREHFLVRRFKETGLWLAADGNPPTAVDNGMPKPVLREFGFTQKEDFEKKLAAERAVRTSPQTGLHA